MTMLRKVFTASAVAIVLASVPSHLAAQERESSKEVRSSVLGWFSGLWHDLAALFAAETSPPPSKPGGPTTQGGCSIDPWGCPGG